MTENSDFKNQVTQDAIAQSGLKDVNAGRDIHAQITQNIYHNSLPKAKLKRVPQGLSRGVELCGDRQTTIPDLLPYLPNRHEQEDKLKQEYQEYLNQGSPRPLVCIIHGDEAQNHDTFFERLRKYAVPQLLGLDRNQTVIKPYFLAIKPYFLGCGMQHLEAQLCEELAKNVLDSSCSSVEAINKVFCTYPGPIIVHSDLINDHWQKDREVLRKVLEFWQGWPDLVAGQQLIICLFVKYKKKGRKSAKRLSLGYLKELFIQNRYGQINTKIYKEISFLSTWQFDRVYSVVLPELDDICQADVETGSIV
jgi:hypothetical protein